MTSLETTLLRTAIGKGTTIFCPRRLKHIVVIFAKQRQRSKEKQYNESPLQLSNVATLPRKMKRSPSWYTKYQKGQNSTEKNKSLLVHIF